MDCGTGRYRSQTCFGFVAWDYLVFGVVLLVSAAIGMYFAYRSRKEAANQENYFLGGRSMTFLPVSLSVSASAISAIAVIGTPAEFYYNGTMYVYIVVGILIASITASEIYIPVLYRLGITSVYEYLERRFNRPVRILTTTIFMINTLLYEGLVIYAPSLALNQVTGLNIWWSAAVITLVCTFYTALGGLKAVVWTDVLQCLIMWIGFLAILIRGSIVLGGFWNVWSSASEGGRIEFENFQFDPTIRHSFWSLSIGGAFLFTGFYGTHQTMAQRYFSCKSENHARASVLLNAVGWAFTVILTGLAGLTMYAYYAGCDPYSKGWVSARDQLMPYFTLELLHDYPGLPGVFVCSVFSGTLSTLSTGINSMAAVIAEDYVKPFKKLNPQQSVVLSKVLVVALGGTCMVMALLAAELGGVLQAAFSVNGLVSGSVAGLFTLGLLFPWCNSCGAIVGLICGLASSTWVFVGSKMYPPASPGGLSLCTGLCNATADESCGVTGIKTTTTVSSTVSEVTEAIPPPHQPIAALYSMSYLYYPIWGFSFSIVTGLITSFLTGYQRPSEVDPSLICAFFEHPVFFCLPKKVKRFLWFGVRREEKVKQYDRSDSDHMELSNLGNSEWEARRMLDCKNLKYEC